MMMGESQRPAVVWRSRTLLAFVSNVAAYLVLVHIVFSHSVSCW